MILPSIQSLQHHRQHPLQVPLAGLQVDPGADGEPAEEPQIGVDRARSTERVAARVAEADLVTVNGGPVEALTRPLSVQSLTTALKKPEPSLPKGSSATNARRKTWVRS